MTSPDYRQMIMRYIEAIDDERTLRKIQIFIIRMVAAIQRGRIDHD